MKVYIVFERVDWEGDSVQGVFDSFEKGQDLCRKLSDEVHSSDVSYWVDEVEVQ